MVDLLKNLERAFDYRQNAISVVLVAYLERKL